MSALEQKVPEGFKQSDIGLIPKTWDVKRFSECFDIIAGLGFGKSEYTQSGLNLLRIDNVSYGKVIWDSVAYLPENYTNKYPHLILEAGDLLLALNRPITNGKLKLAKLAPQDLPSILYQRVGKISSSDKDIDLNFAFYLLTKFIKSFVEESAVGTDQPFISTTKLKKCDLPIPPKNEQTAIANALSDVDALLTELEKLIAKKQAIKTAAMQQLLTGKTRLPQFASYTEGEKQGQLKGTKTSELGEVPEDWNYRSIKEVVMRGAASIKIGPFGSALKKEYLVKSGYKVYGQENVYEKNMEVGDRYISHDHYVQLKSCKIEQGDFLISMMGTIGKCFIAPPDTEEGIMDSHLLRLRLDSKKLEARLLIQLFQTPIILDQISQLSVGGIMDGLSSKIIKSLYLPLPDDITEQKLIANILSDIDNEIQALEQRLAKTRQIKQGMMQELLTGRTRLPFEYGGCCVQEPAALS